MNDDLTRRATSTLLSALLSASVLVIVPSLAMQAIGWPTGTWLARAWLEGRGGHDSWQPIANALDYLKTHTASGLYIATYYHSADQFIYPPTSLVFVFLTSRLDLFDWHSSASLNQAAWWLVPAAMVALGTLALVGLSRQGERLGLGTVILAVLLAVVGIVLFYPLMKGVSLGQIQTWLSLLLMLALLAWTLDSKGAAGIAVGLVCVIKPQLGILVVWGLMRREWKFTAAIAITVMAFLVVSVIIFGWQVHVEYLQLLGSLSSRGESYYANQSMNGLLNRMLFIGNNLTWDGTHTKVAYDARVYILTLVSSAVIIALVLLHRWRRPAGPLDFALALVGFTLASPVAYEHHFGFLPAVFLLAFLALLGRAAPFIAYMVLAGAFLLSANFIGITDALAASHLNFLQSYMMFGALLLLGLLAWITEEPPSSDKLSAVK
jgi:alpha-1,2-mannosyltransferase